jgi:hypothetical protein
VSTPLEELRKEVARLVRQVGHWTPARWQSSGAGPDVHRLAQRLADLTADLEGEPARAVPRLPNDLGLPDQLRVTLADFVAAGPDPAAVAAAATAVGQARGAVSG